MVPALLRVQTERFEREIQRLGVSHNDLVPRNILWNHQLQHFMFIDFERATETATETGREALQEVSINGNRKQTLEKKGVKQSVGKEGVEQGVEEEGVKLSLEKELAGKGYTDVR